MQPIALLGIPIHTLSFTDCVQLIRSWLRMEEQHQIITVNNEMLVESTHNERFRQVLQKNSLNVADSIGVVMAAAWTGQKLAGRIPGVDLVTTLFRNLSSDHSVFLLGARDGIAEKAAQALRQANPNLVIAGTLSGSPHTSDAPAIIERIRSDAPQVLLVAFGAPNQDLWIAEHLHELPSVRIAVGVGGTFDYLAGAVSRAPKVLRAVGLEWFWRLCTQPSRFMRIFRAVVVFPWLIVRYGKRAD